MFLTLCILIFIGKTNKNGVAVTGAGNLKCKYVIHLATPEKLYLGNAPDGKAWEERILHCLREAEHMKLTSVAFPLLGTGSRRCLIYMSFLNWVMLSGSNSIYAKFGNIILGFP